MRSKKGAISMFALLAMLFFLVFVMVAYNNVATKGKTQVETTSVLIDCYKSDTSLEEVYNQMISGNLEDNKIKTNLQSQEAGKEENKGKYMAIDGKVYRIP